MTEPLWQPDAERVERAHLTDFMGRLREGDAFPELAQSLNETYDILRQGVGVESSAEGDS